MSLMCRLKMKEIKNPRNRLSELAAVIHNDCFCCLFLFHLIICFLCTNSAPAGGRAVKGKLTPEEVCGITGWAFNIIYISHIWGYSEVFS